MARFTQAHRHSCVVRRRIPTLGAADLSFFTPDEIVTLARDAGFHDVRHVSTEELRERYFTGRSDGLRPSRGEELVVATT